MQEVILYLDGLLQRPLVVGVLSGVLAIFVIKVGAYLVRTPPIIRTIVGITIFATGLALGSFGSKQYAEVRDLREDMSIAETERDEEYSSLRQRVVELQKENHDLKAALQNSDISSTEARTGSQRYFDADQFVATVTHVRWMDDSRRKIRVTIEFENQTAAELRLAYHTHTGKRYASTDASDSIGKIVVDGLVGRQGRSNDAREDYSAIPPKQTLRTRWDFEVASREPAIQGEALAISAEILSFSERGIVSIPVLIEDIQL